MMPSSSAVSWKSAGSGDGNVSDQFPAGLRVLVVDDDATCLKILEKMLRMCKYEVTKCNRAEVGLSLLRENKNGFDVVISDVHMPDMDGFKLLVHIGLEMDLPVIMMSADDSKSVVMKGVTHGACDYLIKPVRIEALRNIWQHVVRKRKHEWKDLEKPATLDDGHNYKNTDEKQRQPEDTDNSSSANEGENGKNTKRRKYDEDETEERDDSSSMKKPRVVWSHELHQQFVAAVNQLGIEKAVPKKILDLMNVPGLTRENVASHLQKFRLYLRRLSETQQAGGINTSFMGIPDKSYRPISERDFQALASSCQLPAESLATLEAMVHGRSSNLKSDISVDRRNTFSFENPKLRNEQVQNQPGNNSNISKQMNFLQGIPTTMEPKQLVSLQRSFTGMSSQGFISMNNQSQNQSHTHASMQSVLPNAMADNLRQTVLPNGLVPSYGLPNSVSQNKPLDWGLEAVNMTFQPSQHTKYMQGGTNVLKQNFPSGQKIACGTKGFEHFSQDTNEKVNYGTSHQLFCPEEYTQDDLLTVILSQQQLQQEAIGQAENELAFDWNSLDNLLA